jgi:5-methylcytosine-specific restriction endonuclease McrA
MLPARKKPDDGKLHYQNGKRLSKMRRNAAYPAAITDSQPTSVRLRSAAGRTAMAASRAMRKGHALRKKAERMEKIRHLIPPNSVNHGSMNVSQKRARREQLYVRDGRCCALCNRVLKEKGPEELRPTLDHIIPQSRGGSNVLANLRLTCASCNSGRNKDNHFTEFDLTLGDNGVPIVSVLSDSEDSWDSMALISTDDDVNSNGNEEVLSDFDNSVEFVVEDTAVAMDISTFTTVAGEDCVTGQVSAAMNTSASSYLNFASFPEDEEDVVVTVGIPDN